MPRPQQTHPPAQLAPRRWKALALLCTAFFMVILDSAIVVVALPSIDADLAFSPGELQWVLSAYLLSFGGLLLLGGARGRPLGATADVHPRHRPVRTGVARRRTRGRRRGAARRARPAGRGGGDHDPDRALDRHDDL